MFFFPFFYYEYAYVFIHEKCNVWYTLWLLYLITAAVVEYVFRARCDEISVICPGNWSTRRAGVGEWTCIIIRLRDIVIKCSSVLNARRFTGEDYVVVWSWLIRKKLTTSVFYRQTIRNNNKVINSDVYVIFILFTFFLFFSLFFFFKILTVPQLHPRWALLRFKDRVRVMPIKIHIVVSDLYETTDTYIRKCVRRGLICLAFGCGQVTECTVIK